MDICFLVDSRVVASIGLLMDIAGISLLYRYGAIGGKWIDESTQVLLSISGDPEADRLTTERNERLARWGSRCGLGLAGTGFGLQLVAQWI